MKKNDLTLFNKISKEIKQLSKHDVMIGLPKDVGTYPNGMTVLEVGEKHEFGIGVLRRSFLRAPLIQQQKTVNKAIDKGWKNILNGKTTAIKELNILGIVGQNISVDAFKTGGYGKWEDIKQSTKDNKGSDEILMDTGKLRQSVTSWITKS